MLKESCWAYAVVNNILMKPLPFMLVFIIGYLPIIIGV